MTAVSALNVILTLVGNFTKQAAEIGALITDLQANQRSLTKEEWAKLDAALETARKNAETAVPVTQNE